MTNISELLRSLIRINKVFEKSSQNGENLDEKLVNEYERFLLECHQTNPNLLINFNKNDYFAWRSGNENYYKSAGIKAHIANNLGKLEGKTEEVRNNSSVIETTAFDFIENEQLKKILQRDYQDIQKNIVSESWKSAIILAGGSIEAILLDVLLKNETEAKSSEKASSKSDLNNWDLNDLLDTAIDIEVIEPAVGKLGHSVREYRNLVHPGVEMRKNLKIAPEEANIAFNILRILIRHFTT